MKFERSSISSARRPARTETGSVLEEAGLRLPPETPPPLPSETPPPPGNAFRASVTYLIAAALAFTGELFLVLENGTWQTVVLAALGAIVTGLAAFSVRLVRRGQPRLGIWLLIGGTLVSVLLTPLLVAGFGLVLGLGTILVLLNMALQTLPPKEANRTLIATVGVALVAGGLDLLAPPSQLTLPAFQTLIMILGAVIVSVYGLITLRQFSSFPLTTKLILAFLAVSLIPLGLQALLSDRHTRTILTDEAQQSLFAAVSKTASDVDNFILDRLEVIRTEAQLPVLSAYLNLPPAQRAGSAEAMAAAETLRELGLKDKIFINSYALLDTEGRNLIDTRPANIGRDESGRDYFLKPLETGLSYISPVQFTPPDPEGALYFSSPIRSSESEALLGVLRVSYKPAILQTLVVQNNGLVGEQSFAILFDENNIRLAHGLAPDLIFQPVAGLDPAQVQKLQADGRLPAQVQIESGANLPELVTGLDNAIFEPHFTSRLAPTGERQNLVVIKELETQPWSVLFAQPQDLFLSPIQAQTRITLFLAIAIAGCVAAAAFVMGQYLANPLVDLTKTVTRFTTGQLEARASLTSNDESGILAASFNKMAAQVGALLKSLAERTRELEAEIGERRRAEIDLQASEQKYRRLFEDSRDVIFITASDGQIVDINPPAAELFGYNHAELKGMKMQDLYVEPGRHLDFRQEIEARGAVRDFEVQFLRQDQARRVCLMTATVRRDDDGHILGYQGIIRDITEQKRVEREHLRLLAIEQELTLAKEIQQNLLPSSQPDWAGPDAICYSLPAREMGGDLYAYHAFNSGRYALAVGDVSGKGMPAALLMAVSVASFQAVVGQGLSPPALLGHLDRAIAPYTRTTGQNCALVYVELTLAGEGRRRLNVANAGCMPPLIRKSNGTVTWVDAYGTPLGTRLSSEIGYRENETWLSAGDLMILTSDGVVEAINREREMFGFERLEQAVAAGPTSSAQAMLAHLKGQVHRFIDGAEPNDDLTIVVVQV